MDTVVAIVLSVILGLLLLAGAVYIVVWAIICAWIAWKQHTVWRDTPIDKDRICRV